MNSLNKIVRVIKSCQTHEQMALVYHWAVNVLERMEDNEEITVFDTVAVMDVIYNRIKEIKSNPSLRVIND